MSREKLTSEFRHHKQSSTLASARLESIDEVADEYELPRVLSRTKDLYDQLQARRREVIASSFESPKPSDVILPSITNQDSKLLERLKFPSEAHSSVVGLFRARNRWMKVKPNLREHAEEVVLQGLRRDRKTFITQVEQTDQDLEPRYRRLTHPPTNIRTTHYFWSTVPSEEEMIGVRFKEFMKGKVLIVTVYNQVRANIDRHSARIIYSAENRTPLTKKHALKVANKNKNKVTIDSIAKNVKEYANKYSECATTFDPAEYRRDATRAGGISVNVKIILRTDPDKRTAQQLRAVNEAMTRLKCFDGLIQAGALMTAKIIKQLCKTAEMEKFEKDRTILKQGHSPDAFYFIITGSVGVYKTRVDNQGVPWTDLKATLGQGQNFGEIAFLQGGSQRRTATVITKTACELLRINKDTFEKVLLEAKNAEWKERLEFMHQIPILQQLSSKELELLNEASFLEMYDDDTVVLGNTKGRQTHVKFVYKGKCILVRRVFLKKTKELRIMTQIVGGNVHKPPSHYSIATKDDMALVNSHGRRLGKSEIIKEKMLMVSCFQPKDYFGTGEDLTDTFIIAKGRVVCLQVPTLEFLLRSPLRTVLTDMNDIVSEAIPSSLEIFHRYKTEQRWKKYKEGIVNSVLLDKQTKRRLCQPFPQINRKS